MKKIVLLSISVFLVNSIYGSQKFEVIIPSEIHNARAFAKASVEKDTCLYLSFVDRNKQQQKLQLSSCGVQLLCDAIYNKGLDAEHFIQLQESNKKEQPKTFNCRVPSTCFEEITKYWEQISTIAMLAKEEGECPKITQMAIAGSRNANSEAVTADILIKENSVSKFLETSLHCVSDDKEKAFIFSEAAVKELVSVATAVPISYGKIIFPCRFFHITLGGTVYQIQLNRQSSFLIEQYAKDSVQKEMVALDANPATNQIVESQKEEVKYAIFISEKLDRGGADAANCTLVSQGEEWHIIGDNLDLAVNLTKSDLESINGYTEIFYLLVDFVAYEITQVEENILHRQQPLVVKQPQVHFYQKIYFLLVGGLTLAALISGMIFFRKNNKPIML